MTARSYISVPQPTAGIAFGIYIGRLVATAMLALLLPALALIGILVWVDDPGQVFFRQVRCGLRGRFFVIYKFRTMRPDTEGQEHAARTTRVGRFLRRLGLDELPQLLNIARGEMSFVGPRPTLPEQVMKYGDRERRRLEVKPGITGWSQVNGRNGIDWSTRIDLDVWYVDHRSVLLDLQILLMTIPAVLSGDGVYGKDGRNPDYQPSSPPSRKKAA